jgi:hypothetical protein
VVGGPALGDAALDPWRRRLGVRVQVGVEPVAEQDRISASVRSWETRDSVAPSSAAISSIGRSW